MAAELHNSVFIKILYDKEKNKVVCAESNSDFIDILFSFLTLPMGTIARLIQKEKPPDLLQFGFMNLYQSVISLGLTKFNTDHCKDMLTYPKNPLETICKDLKVNLDDTPTKYFLCADVACYKRKLSYYKNVKCSCGKLLNREVSNTISSSKASGEGDNFKEITPPKVNVGVFLKRSRPYFVTDSMKIMHGTPGTLLELLRQHGIDNVNVVEEKVLKLGPEEILKLLVNTLISKTPLTDTFLPIQKLNMESLPVDKRDNQVTSKVTSANLSDKSLEIKIFVRKSDKKPLYAETTEDFVELLLSFLTFPLSNVVNCLNGNSSLECVDNLYKSVEGLNNKWFFENETSRSDSSSTLKNLLLDPGIALNFKCSKETLNFYVRNSGIDRFTINEKGEFCGGNYLRSFFYRLDEEELLQVTNPKAREGESDIGFLKKPAMFNVSDCFVVKPCDGTSSNIFFIKGLNVPVNDIEEHTVKITKQEALSILKASLTTSSAFAPIVDLIFKKRKPDNSKIILD